MWIEKSPCRQHGAGDPQQAIGHGADGAAVRLASLAQGGIALAAQLVMLDGDPSPMVDGMARPVVTGVAHHHDFAFATPFGHQGDPTQRPQSVVISGIM